MSSMRSASSRTSTWSRAEIEEIAAEVIFEASWSGDDQPRTGANRRKLLRLGQSADDQRRGAKLLPAQRVVLIHHLHGEFPCGNEHERFDPLALVKRGAAP